MTSLRLPAYPLYCLHRTAPWDAGQHKPHHTHCTACTAPHPGVQVNKPQEVVEAEQVNPGVSDDTIFRC